MNQQKGNLSIHSENIFPIIKKWLYSDHDIFVRELVSNASDAITKLKKLSTMKEVALDSEESFKIEVRLNEADKTIVFSDNGIGMTDEEIKKYINQIAFSGAEDFLNTYKDKSDKDQIIGHFGLGFYSAFMVAEKVEIHTKSYLPNTDPVLWTCDGGTTFEMETGSREHRGTDITLFIGDEGKSFLNAYTLRQTLDKYCSFMPYEIYLTVEGEEAKEDAEPQEAKPLNTTTPLYMKMPSECTDEDYKDFYQATFKDFKEPLFWIHLNMDYPFNLKGILYFPKLNTEFDTIEGQIKLYNSQVFVADNIKEVIPEFLLLLKGVIDCPDLPLNVSRSFLQNDGFVRKISTYISKKVADKLNGLFKTERESYEGFWEDINPFIKFGTLKDEKFFENVEKSILFKTIQDQYVTLDEYLAEALDKHENKVFYVTDHIQQAQYINLFEAHDLNAVLLEHTIDAPFISMLESKKENLSFARVDSDLNEFFKEAGDAESDAEKTKNEEKLQTLFRDVLENEKLEVKLERMKNNDLSSMIILSEESRRMQDMMRMYGSAGLDPKMFETNGTLILNANHVLVSNLITNETLESSTRDMICAHLYDLAMLSHTQLSPEAMTRFVSRSNLLLTRLIS
ncbi:molecular chaperone HtpG [Fusibacter tunisiensis]|uniref:Molecular chaperone HtpG n=1 Tax=Fusibacter tunisiensis TaxID=1008308 RepID=A0ABS2MS57_9FIRM|nr:molecular chaperone HtpG [Fusibacter tunisiensis]MBM7562251.1 molecular chaperone HtpG [Fusibacter tunisiensis]